MTTLAPDTLKAMLKELNGPCVSIYLPTHRGPAGIEENRIRFKNLLHQAELRLKDLGHRNRQAEDILKPARDTFNETVTRQPQGRGLGVLCSSNGFFSVSLPYECEEIVVVNDHFHVKPLIPLATENPRFYLLCLAQNDVRLFKGDRDGLQQVQSPDLPKSLESALGYDDNETPHQFHTEAAPQGPAGEGRPAMFHGHGISGTDHKKDIQRFCRRVDQAVTKLVGNDRAPLVLAAVDYLVPLYKEAASSKNLLDSAIEGNPEHKAAEELHREAISRVNARALEARQKVLEQFQQAVSKDRGSNDLEQIIPAASEARVSDLLVAHNRQLWGRFDPESRVVHIDEEARPGNEDLLNVAAVHTLKHGGTVHALSADEMPDNAVVGAVYRF